MKKALVMVSLMAVLGLSSQVALGQWGRGGMRAGSAMPGGGGGREWSEPEDRNREPPVDPPYVPGMPKYFTLTPVSVSSKLPSERNFETAKDSFTSPQIVLNPDEFSASNIRDLAFSPDGRYLAIAGDVVQICDVDSGELLHTLWGQREFGGIGAGTSVAYSPDGRYLVVAAAGYDASLRVYDTNDFSEIKEVYGGHNGHIVRVAFSRDGRYLATAGVDNDIHVWDWPQRKKTKSYLMDGPVVLLEFPSEHDNLLAIVKNDEDWRVFYWSPGTDKMVALESERQTLHRLLHEASPIQKGQVHLHATEIHCDLGYAIFGIHDDRATGQNKFRCGVWSGSRLLAEFKHAYFVTAATYHPARDLVASADAVGQVYVWSAKTGKRIAEFRAPSIGIFSVEFDGPVRLKFGRQPYNEGGGWGWNHYAPLTEFIDLTQQRTGTAGQQRTGEQGPAVVDRLGDLRVRFGSNWQVSVDRAGRTLSSITFGRSTEDRPLTCGILRSNDAGFTQSVVVGCSNGMLTAHEPDNLLMKRLFLGHTAHVWCFSQSPDGRLMATASGDNTIRIWSLREAGRHIGNLPVFVERDGRISDLTRGTPASKVLKVGDRVLKIAGRRVSELADQFAATGQWPLQPGQQAVVEYESNGKVQEATIQLSDMGEIVLPLLTIKVSDDGGDWIAWTPRGYYAASSGGDRMIGWQENQGRDRAARFNYADQFRDRFDRPDIVLRAFETADLDQAIQLANDSIPKPPAPADIREDLPEIRPPVVKILAPLNNEKFKSPDMTVRAEITTSGDASVPEVSVIVNGRTYHARNIVREGAGANEHGQVFEQQIRLSPGENRISVSARAASIGRSEVVSVTCEPFEIQRRLLTVALGVSDYQNEAIRDLEYTTADAQQFIAAMERQRELGQFTAVESRLLIGDEATRAKAEEAIGWLTEKAQDEDVIAFFVSGHGLLDKADNYFIATREANPDNPLLTCMEWGKMDYLVRSVPCRVLLFVDTCHAGGILGGRAMQRNPYRNLHSQELGAYVFAAASPGESAFERAGNGLFTRALLATLDDPESDQDNPADHCLSYSELSLSLDRRVKNLSGQTQEAYIEKPQGQGKDIALFRLPSGGLN